MNPIARKIDFLKRKRDTISTQAMRTFDVDRFNNLERQFEELNTLIWELESQLP